MQNLYIVINQWGQWCTHKKMLWYRASFTWEYTPWNKNVIKFVNLVICEKILGIVVLMVAF